MASRTKFTFDFDRAVDYCPKLGNTIPREEGQIRYTTAYSPKQALLQVLKTLGNPSNRPIWAMSELEPYLSEIIKTYAEEGNDIANFQLPMADLLE